MIFIVKKLVFIIFRAVLRDGQNWTEQEVKKSEPYIDIYKDIKPLSLEAKRQSSSPLEPKWKIEDLEE